MPSIRTLWSVAALTLAAVTLSVSPAAATSSITAKVSAPPRIHQSPFTITFSGPVKNVATTGALGSDLYVSDVKKADAYPGQVICYDSSNKKVGCGAGPVTTVQLTTKANLTAGQYYQVNLGPKITDYTTGDTLSPSQTVVRAQTVFGPNQFGETYTWMTVDLADQYGGSYIEQQAPNATAVYNFTGTSFGLYTGDHFAGGTAIVTITQVGGPTISQTIDTYSAVEQDDVLWSWPSLLPGKHRFTLTTTGMHDAASSDSIVDVDAVVVGKTIIDTPNFTLTWGHPASWLGHPAGWSGTSGIMGEAGLATMTLSFYGSGVTVSYATGPQMGQGTVTIDDSAPTTIDEEATSIGSASLVSGYLGLGIHQVTLTATDGRPFFNYRTITIQ